ncbi:MAG TPA: MBL fold metallo-hydrolase [Clostridia bacterium]|nr:MBL fold metallo-hydrolase [Clostridia bacterium]
MKVVVLSVGLLGANSYIIYDEKKMQGAIIDPGGDPHIILKKIDDLGLNIKYILLTHGHFDHIDAVGEIKDKTGAQIAIHKEEAPSLTDIFKNLSFSMGMESVQPEADLLLEKGDVLEVGEISLKVIHTPGHSPGSISILGDGLVFTGDTLFKGSIGRTDFIGGNAKQILQSISNELLILEDKTIVYSGHGPATSIGAEKSTNPFLEGLI